MDWLATILKTVGPAVPASMSAWALRKYFNHNFKSFGVMTNLQIDSANKRASLDLDLKGETQPLRVTINRYELTSEGGQTFIEFKEVDTSREWINYLAGQFLKGRKFAVPEIAQAIL